MPPPADAPAASQPSSSRAALRVVLWPALAALAFVPFGMGLLQKSLALGEQPPPMALLGLAIGDGALVLLAPGTVLAALLAMLGLPRAALTAAVSWSVAALLWLTVDLSVYGFTGNHLPFYLDHASQTEALRWAGAQGLTSLLVAQGRHATLIVGAALLPALLLDRILARWPHALQPGPALAALLALWLAAIGGRALLPASEATEQIDAALPRPWSVAGPARLGGSATAVRLAEAAYRKSFARSGARAPQRGTRAAQLAPATVRPDVLVLVLESWRADALDPRYMPRLAEWARGGARFTNHHSNAPNSLNGLFALVSSELPWRGRGVMPRGERLLLTELLQANGFETHFLTSASMQWFDMRKVIRQPNFALHEETRGTNPERDERTVATARALLGTREPPRLVVVFPMSSHWRYESPPQYEALDPPIDPPAEPERQRLLRAEMTDITRTFLGLHDYRT